MNAEVMLSKYLHEKNGYQLGLTGFDPDSSKDYSYYVDGEIVVIPNPFIGFAEKLKKLEIDVVKCSSS